MKVYIVVPFSHAADRSWIAFSSMTSAVEFVKQNDCLYKSEIQLSEVLGDYTYPNELYVLSLFATMLNGENIIGEVHANESAAIDKKGQYDEILCLVPDCVAANIKLEEDKPETTGVESYSLDTEDISLDDFVDDIFKKIRAVINEPQDKN